MPFFVPIRHLLYADDSSIDRYHVLNEVRVRLASARVADRSGPVRNDGSEVRYVAVEASRPLHVLHAVHDDVEVDPRREQPGTGIMTAAGASQDLDLGAVIVLMPAVPRMTRCRILASARKHGIVDQISDKPPAPGRFCVGKLEQDEATENDSDGHGTPPFSGYTRLSKLLRETPNAISAIRVCRLRSRRRSRTPPRWRDLASQLCRVQSTPVACAGAPLSDHRRARDGDDS